MKASGFWKADGFIALVIDAALALAAAGGLLQGLERSAYDASLKFTPARASDRVAVIAIDAQSIASIGRWPWPREVHARMTDVLTQAGARVVGNTVPFTEQQFDPARVPGHAGIIRLREMLSASALKDLSAAAAVELDGLEAVAASVQASLDTDRTLAASLQASGNTVLGMVFQRFDREPSGKPDTPLPNHVSRNAVPMQGQAAAGDARPLSGLDPVVPVVAVGSAAAGIGHLNPVFDTDGAVRAEALVVRHHDQLLPSMALLLAARSLNLAADKIQIEPGTGVRLGRLAIGTDARRVMQTRYYPGSDVRPAFAVDSFDDVLNGRVPAAKFRDRIVLVGTTAVGISPALATPVDPGMPGVLALAHNVSNLLQQEFVVTPWWSSWVRWSVFLLVLAWLMLALPRMRTGIAVAVTALLAIALPAMQFGLMAAKLAWVPLMLPLTLLLLGHLVLGSRQRLATAPGTDRSDDDLAHSRRMLGLGYQGQGQFDSAFECFRRLPVDESVLELLYNLGLAYERKRQYDRAGLVFRYMAEHDPKFRDIGERSQRAAQLQSTAGAASDPGHAEPSPTPGKTAAKPMLGRFEIQKELGKGAMGVVYLGRDPKIGRVVAIKTMALAQAFEGDELAEVKERFFREAQTAGRLAHPNIVTIYDVGEAHDLAFIAMEFLKGGDLIAYTRPDALLPLSTVLGIVARVAEALAYAHRNNVVHRDVKPGNVMYDPLTNSVKMTDFGIARITDSSRTKTGMVLGTPSFMSPEQLSGQKIDGKSDLFSLGVMLYQLCCGQLPFKGESMAQLMFRIANEPPPDIRAIRPDLPGCLVSIIHVALAKQPQMRFQSGDEMAAAVRECAKVLV